MFDGKQIKKHVSPLYFNKKQLEAIDAKSFKCFIITLTLIVVRKANALKKLYSLKPLERDVYEKKISKIS